METSGWEDSLFDAPSDVPVEIPSVVAVMVTTDPGERFDDALASLAAQDYPSLTVLVIDAGSRDDPTPRIGAVLPDAFIRRLGERVTWAAAANEALTAVEGANYLLFCTDDVAAMPDAVSLLVEEAVRSNAGIVGPKFVDADRPEVIVQVGMGADKMGVPFSPAEPGEIDHEQHDAVRDVFSVPHATMLVRADLLASLGGFDAHFEAGIEELDLCWRARLAGARVIVAPDAVVRRPLAALEARYGRDPDVGRVLEPRHRLKMLLRNYSGWSLVRVLPQAFAISFVQAVMLASMGRGRRAGAVARSWFWNFRHLPATLGERRAVQAHRAIPDSDIRTLQIRGSSYLRAFFAGQLDLGGRLESVSGAGRDLVVNFSAAVRHPSFIFGVALLVLVLMGGRDLVTGGVPSVGSFLPWPSASDFFREFTSAWRYVGVGSSTPAPPAQFFMGVLSALGFGSGALAQTLLVVLAIPVGAFGAHRLMRPLARSPWAPIGAAAAYAVNPVPRNLIAEGRLGPLVFFMAAPFLLERLLRLSGVSPYGVTDEAHGHERDRRRALLSLALLLAVVAAFFPPAVLLVPVMAVAMVASSSVSGDRVLAVRGLVGSLGAVVIAVLLLFPWSLGLLLPTPDLGALGFTFRDRPELADLLQFDTGPATLGMGWILAAVAAHPLLVGSGFRLRWATRAWFMALAGWALAWLPGRLGLDVGMPPVDAVLVVAALGMAMAIGLGAGVLRDELRRAGLSWRQVVSVAAVGTLLVAALPFLADVLDGRWKLERRDWQQSLAWMESESVKGGFRVLWVGSPAVLPLDPSPLDDGTGWGLTRNGTGAATELLPPPSDGATGHVESSLEVAIAGRTDRLGHMLGPVSVRYIAYPLRNRPAAGERTGTSPPNTALTAALARQTDLVQLDDVDPNLVLYENRAWVPAGALLTGEGATDAAAEREPLRTEASADDRPVPGLPRSPRVRVKEADRDLVEGVLMTGEAYHRSWEATADRALRPHVRAFGLMNGFVVEDVDRVVVTHDGQLLRYGAVAVEGLFWLFVVGAWRRRRHLERSVQAVPDVPVTDVRPGVPT